MKWVVRPVLPLVLATASLAFPFSYNAAQRQAAFRVNHVSGSEEFFLDGWEQPPNSNSTHHLIFNSVIGLLQRWPNTYRRNGAFNLHRGWPPDAS
jgi:hypothetical protein